MRPSRATVACVLYLLAVPGYVTCFLRHICMCGHLAHVEGSGWWWELASDSVWFGPLVAASLFGLTAGVRRARLVGVMGLVLLGSRCLLASGGGYCALMLELPALLLGCWHATRQIAGHNPSPRGSA